LAIVTKKRKSPVLGFYWRKFIAFAVFFLLLSVSFSGYSYFKADLRTFISEIGLEALNITVDVRENGSIFIDGKKSKEYVSRAGGNDEVRFPIIDAPGQFYRSATIALTLPKDIADKTEIDIKGIHGVDYVSAYRSDAKTIIYEASGISPQATVSVIAKMPKGTIDYPLVLSLVNLLNLVKYDAWIIIGIIIPLISFIIMIFFLRHLARGNKSLITAEKSEAPPASLPPAIVGALYSQRVSSREIAATLVDLAQRGVIYIMDRDRGFAFAKNKFDSRLLPYEKVLLLKIFSGGSVSATQKDLQKGIDTNLYSKEMTLLTGDIYSLSTRLGYFKMNPQKIHYKYRTIAVFSLLISMVGFFMSLFLFRNPPFIVFFWLGMAATTMIIFSMAKNIPIRTNLGQEALINWLGFRNFLTDKEKISFSYDNFGLFQKYLPYAIVLNCEVLWAKRFSEQNFSLPEWYLSDKRGLDLQDFCLSLFPIISYVARNLTASREPGVE